MAVSFPSRKLLFPFLVSKDIKPVAFLLSSRDLIVCLSLILLLAQVSESLKVFFSSKEIQKLPSVKLYSKLLSVGRSSLSLSYVSAISKTLGADLDTLSLLLPFERIRFLRSLHFNLMYDRVEYKSSHSSRIFVDPFELSSYRRSLALQCRGIFSATPVFLPHSLVQGSSVLTVDLSLILDSCKSLWYSWGFDECDFEFSLMKEAMKIYLNNDLSSFFSRPFDILEACKIIVFSEFHNNMVSMGKVYHENDLVIFPGCKNLTCLEEEFGFFVRTFPKMRKPLVMNDVDLQDDVIKLAVQQRKSYDLHLHSLSNSFIK